MPRKTALVEGAVRLISPCCLRSYLRTNIQLECQSQRSSKTELVRRNMGLFPEKDAFGQEVERWGTGNPHNSVRVGFLSAYVRQCQLLPSSHCYLLLHHLFVIWNCSETSSPRFIVQLFGAGTVPLLCLHNCDAKRKHNHRPRVLHFLQATMPSQMLEIHEGR